MSNKIISLLLDFMYNENVVEIIPIFLESKQQYEMLVW